MAQIFEYERATVPLSITLDAVTYMRLTKMARACGAEPVMLAASIVHDVLKDDAMNEAESAGCPAVITIERGN